MLPSILFLFLCMDLFGCTANQNYISHQWAPQEISRKAQSAYLSIPLEVCLVRLRSRTAAELIGFTLVIVCASTRSAVLCIYSVAAPAIQSNQQQIPKVFIFARCQITETKFKHPVYFQNKTLSVDARLCITLLHQQNVTMAGAKPEVKNSEVSEAIWHHRCREAITHTLCYLSQLCMIL